MIPPTIAPTLLDFFAGICGIDGELPGGPESDGEFGGAEMETFASLHRCQNL